ncbi:unnamed protein product [Trichobilharzia regenti]|nr:unnamed protein product [Trichobilharzia regenti]
MILVQRFIKKQKNISNTLREKDNHTEHYSQFTIMSNDNNNANNSNNEVDFPLLKEITQAQKYTSVVKSSSSLLQPPLSIANPPFLTM